MNTPSMNTIMGSKQVQNPLLQSVLLLIVFVIFSWFILIPKYTSYTEKKSQLDTAENQFAALESDQREMNKLISKLESSENQVKLLDEALPLSNRPTQISLLLESYATSSGLEISQINVSDESAAANPIAGDKKVLADPFGVNRALETVSVSVTVSGNIDQFKNFLQILESSGRIVDVENMDVTSGDGTTRFTVKLKTYAFEPV